MARRTMVLLLIGIGLTELLGCAQMSAYTPFEKGGYAQKPKAKRQLDLPSREAAQVCLTTAEELEKGGKYVSALFEYEMARHKDPSLKHVSRRLAVLYEKLGKFSQAQREYKIALELTPNDPDLLNDIGYGLYCRGQWKEAEKYLRRAIKHKPDHARALTNLGLSLGQQKRYSESVAAFQKAGLTPAQAYCNVGFIYATQGNTEQARSMYLQALHEEPDLRLARAFLESLDKQKEDPEVQRVESRQRKRRETSRRPARRQSRPEPAPAPPARDLQSPVMAPDPFANNTGQSPVAARARVGGPNSAQTWESNPR